MIDPRLLRDDPDLVRTSLRRRGESPDKVDALVAADAARRSAIAEFEALRAEQKQIGRQVAQASGDDKTALLERTKSLSAQVKEADAQQGRASEEFDGLLRSLPNLVAPEAPEGGEEDFTVLDVVGTPRDFAAEGFEPRDHLEIGHLLGAERLELGDRGAAGGIGGHEGVDLVGRLAATAQRRAHELGIVTEEAGIDHPVSVTGSRTTPLAG